MCQKHTPSQGRRRAGSGGRETPCGGGAGSLALLGQQEAALAIAELDEDTLLTPVLFVTSDEVRDPQERVPLAGRRLPMDELPSPKHRTTRLSQPTPQKCRQEKVLFLPSENI